MIYPAPTVVCLPTRSYPGVVELVQFLLTEEIDGLDIFDNGHGIETAGKLAEIEARDERIRVWDARGDGIYKMWNDGIKTALEDFEGPVNVAILNDDIKVLPGSIEVMAEHLRRDPDLWLVCADYTRTTKQTVHSIVVDHVRGTYRQGGICGWCYMVKGEKFRGDVPFIDEGFEIWYGDDDLAYSITKAGGKLAILRGLPVDHVGEATVSLLPETHEMKERDRERFEAKWHNA